ncbi:hypothetical protein D9M69_374770 [compost metagenome]
MAAAQGVVEGALLGFQIGQLAADQLQLGGQLLDAFGEGVGRALEFVLGGFRLGELFQLGWFLGRKSLAAAEVFQRLLRIEHFLIQPVRLRLACATVGGHALLGLELLQFLLQALLLVAQGGAVGEGLQCRRFDMAEVDGQAGYFEALALESVENLLDAGYPLAVFIEAHALFAQRQAEQRAVEQAHQAFNVLLGELLAQAGIAVVVGVFELLANAFQAFLQIAHALVEVLAGELPRVRQGAGQFVVGILGGEQLLLQLFGVLDQGEAILQHCQFAQPALGFADLALQAHQFLGAAALFVLQAVLLATVVLGLDDQLFLARAGIVLPGAEQAVEQRRQAMHLAAQEFTLGHAVGQRLDQRAGGDQRLVVALHAAHVAEGFLAGGDVVDAAGAQAVLEGVEEQLLELGRGDLAHVQQVDEQRAEGLQALLAGGAQRDQGEVQRNRSVPADQQAAQLVRLQFVGLEAGAFQAGVEFAQAQAGAVLLVVVEVQFALVGEELVAEAAARAAPAAADHVAAVGQLQFDEDVAGVGGEVELARLLQAVLAEAHVRHPRQDRELQGVDRGALAEVVGAVDRQRLLQREDAEAVAGGIEQGEAADSVAFLGHS